MVAPYLYLDGKDTPNPVAVMARTGLRWFSLAFVLSDGGCTPVWDRQTGLGGQAAHVAARVRRAGGRVVVSIGGADGRKLGVHCPDPRSLAAAYQKVVDTYRLTAVDIDVENAELEDARVQDRILHALAILGRDNANLTISVTLPADSGGLTRRGTRMVQRAHELGSPVDVWAIMPFNLGAAHAKSADMGQLAIRAAEHARAQLASVYPGRSGRALDHMLGIVLMNGRTDTGELVTPRDFRLVRDYAEQHHLARLAFWSVNRDRACGRSRSASTCSGIAQQPWEFSRILQGAARRG
ncbi:MAG TPA: chitinase [Segeticoccus sp.]|uniref:chitinase n=1 Tax=Segeticoccus sp. TaxID=2706531 RepID=UPI002D7EDF0D|nr:chitinase [Segeticoccus sp.]HET8598795.1 chitinase [Segeticoccus sp.]